MLFHGYYIFSTQPLIVSYLGSYPFFGGVIYQDKKMKYKPLPKWFRPKHLLEHSPYWCAAPKQMFLRKIKSLLHSLEGRTHHFMVNAADEEEMRKRFQIRGAHFNQNFYINEHLYSIIEQPKLYDAIYTAQLNSSKRLGLAKNIEKLMVVSYGGDLHAYCPELKHADFNKEFIPRPELAKKYNQAHAGLILSALEGANLASSEYLLCGIPVVSTPSKGGRDEFFTPENSTIVPPEADAVAQAVQNWKKLSPEPQKIREQTLTKMKDLRLKYCAYISQLINKESGKKYEPKALMEKYFGSSDGIQSRYIKLQELYQLTPEDFHTKFSI
ncbi:glycosyltransferase [Rivularia sp. PCC 7116]|uniref:glycosyltransferase n=1 Tax=Rivularia sp. PCC 7116 TaxID=373994 RepID=UPI00029EF605|nr:glycosyltransferase [Rivularia sp. PCC 7116]AFY57860.1 glycosyltransferase [Rivularia sp. PCC 7116]